MFISIGQWRKDSSTEPGAHRVGEHKPRGHFCLGHRKSYFCMAGPSVFRCRGPCSGPAGLSAQKQDGRTGTPYKHGAQVYTISICKQFLQAQQFMIGKKGSRVDRGGGMKKLYLNLNGYLNEENLLNVINQFQVFAYLHLP